jgi:hypothetical protein
MVLQIKGSVGKQGFQTLTLSLLSMNEGKFPAGEIPNSFIPYDVKRELGLPREKDAIYTYHFTIFCLCARIYLLLH